MSKYQKDRAFSDYIHSHLAVPLIYESLKWREVQLRKDYAKYIDMMDGIDYVFRNGDQIISVQERFRASQYKFFSDFTIRYRRDMNKVEDRHKSEYYKLKAHYFTYGIINTSKKDYHKASCFLKYAIIDLKKVYEKLDSKAIFISDSRKNKCEIVDGNRINCPIKYNSDGSSSFFPLDISYLVQLWGDSMIIDQKGFF
jgi:hypothetical protein